MSPGQHRGVNHFGNSMRGVVGHLSMRNLIQNGPCSAVNGNRRSSSIGMITKKLRMYSSIAPPSMYVFDRASKKIQRVRGVSVCLEPQ